MKFNKTLVRSEYIGCEICPDCNEVHDRSHVAFVGECPNCGSRKDGVIVDEMLCPAIIELNKKGYITKACCSGHTYDKGGYISFNNHSMLNSLIDFVSKNNEYPSNITYYNLEKEFEQDKICIRWKQTDKKQYYISILKDLLDANEMIYKWACSLPDLTKGDK